MQPVRRLLALLAGVILLQGNLELGALACVLQHDRAAAATTHAGHVPGRADEARGAVSSVLAAEAPVQAPAQAPCEGDESGACGTGPMAPGHCATMHAGTSAATAPTEPPVLRSTGSHQLAAALPAAHPTSRAFAPDVPPPRA